MGAAARQAARCRRNTKGQETDRTNETLADGFLRQQFLPLMQAGTDLPEKRQAEQGFYSSLPHLPVNGLAAMATHKNKPFPYNILLSFWQLRQRLAYENSEHLFICQKRNGKIALATKRRYDMGSTLYFIPVIPVFKLMQDKANRRSADLLLSVFAYLYHVAGVPFYRDCDATLSSYYDMLSEWLTDDRESYEQEEWNSCMADIHKATFIGDVMHRKIYNQVHLEQFANRLKSFRAATDFQLQCLRLAEGFFNLWQSCPDRCIFDHVQLEDEAGYDQGCIRADQCISFVADTEGWLHEQLVDMLNTDFNECPFMETPAITQIHDGTLRDPTETLDFEYGIFELIDDLCTLLYEQL